MRPCVVTQDGVGYSAWIPLDIYVSPANVLLSTKVTDVATYTIEMTDDDPFQSGGVPSDGTENVFQVPGLTALVVSAYQALNVPARAVRINQLGGTGSVRLTVTTAGIGGT